jgi:hypothetical protein
LINTPIFCIDHCVEAGVVAMQNSDSLADFCLKYPILQIAGSLSEGDIQETVLKLT